YQGVRIADAGSSTVGATVPITLTNNRTAAGIATAISTDPTAAGGSAVSLSASQINPVSLAMLQAQLPNGQYLIPSANITNLATAKQLGYDALQVGPNTEAHVNQGSGNFDYLVSDKDRLAFKYYYQNDPTTTPFAA